MKIAYLGPEGTFTEQAARIIAKDWEQKNVSTCPIATIDDVFELVENDGAELGVVPVENSIEGAVSATIDLLIFDTGLFISRQLSMPIIQNMMVNRNNTGKKITKILSHSQGLAQCRRFLSKNYPDAVIEAVSSTSEASRIVSQNDGGNEVVASIGAAICSEIYGLSIIHENIQDNPKNTTQFIVISKADTSEPKAGHKTSIAFSTENKPGELYKILDIFSIWDLNLTKIVSRPTKNRQGEYVFFIDIDGYKNIQDVNDALKMIKRKTSFYKNLGSYRVQSI